MNNISYEERRKVYTNALVTYGDKLQYIVAIEELSECAKEICKVLRGKGNIEHLAEEVADATIMLEQLRYYFGIDGLVCQKMDEKIRRLDDNLKRGAKNG